MTSRASTSWLASYVRRVRCIVTTRRLCPGSSLHLISVVAQIHVPPLRALHPVLVFSNDTAGHHITSSLVFSGLVCIHRHSYFSTSRFVEVLYLSSACLHVDSASIATLPLMVTKLIGNKVCNARYSRTSQVLNCREIRKGVGKTFTTLCGHIDSR